MTGSDKTRLETVNSLLREVLDKDGEDNGLTVIQHKAILQCLQIVQKLLNKGK